MAKIWHFLKERSIACFGIAVFAVCALTVFLPALPKFIALLSPDSGPYFAGAYRTAVLEGC